MAYNLGTVREAVRNRLDDEDFEQEYLDAAINFAQWEITNKHHLSFLEAEDSFSINTSDVETVLPTDFHEYLYLTITAPYNYRNNLTERYVDYEDFLNTFYDPVQNPVNVPLIWTEYGRKIKWAAPSDQTYTAKLSYLRSSPKLVNDTDVPDIPEEFQELLILGAYMRIAKREDDYDVKSQEQIDYTKLLTDLLHVYGRKKRPGGMRKMRVS